MKEVNVKIKLIEDGKMPEYKRDGDVCLDCYARLGADYIKLPPHSRCLVNLGFALQLPEGWEAVVRPRSGNSKNKIDISLGTCDTNYRGEFKACVCNNSDGEFRIEHGDRICQLAVREAPVVYFTKVDELDETERGENGFGSSGNK